MDTCKISEEDEIHGVTGLNPDTAVVESQCIACGANGTTKVLATKIPHFRGVVLMSFECNECGYSNNEIQEIAPMKDYGVEINAKINSIEGLNNQIVLSANASIKLVELDFEVQPTVKNGIVTTIEGYLSRVISDLNEHIQSIDDAMARENSLSIQLSTGEIKPLSEYIHKLLTIKDSLLIYSSGDEPFTISIKDPSGNSYIEDTDAVEVSETRYKRTDKHLESMGYPTSEDFRREIDLTQPLEDDDVEKEGLSLFVDCPNCCSRGENKICEVAVPGFGKCLVMAFTCENCGAKSNEIKPGGGYKELGKRWKLDINSPEDLNRDVILSDTATIIIEHLDIEATSGTVGSALTTVEGLIIKLVEGLELSHPFAVGDSSPEVQSSLRSKIKQLSQLSTMEGIKRFTIVIDDPVDHSFIGPRPRRPDPDTNLSFETYKRSHIQDEELGLIGMNTEDY